MSDVEKLPKWARDKIVGLEREVETLTHVIAARNGEAVGGHVQINPYSPSMLAFSDDSLVRFVIGSPDWSSYFEVRLARGGVSVRSGGPMTIHPEVSNSILLKMAD